jgi:hypothetical protein
MEKRVKRLEIAVLALSIMVVSLIGIGIYGVDKIIKLTDKIPDHEKVDEYVDKAGNIINYFKKEENE